MQAEDWNRIHNRKICLPCQFF